MPSFFFTNHECYRQCMNCGHYFPGNEIARWDSLFTTLGPHGMRQLEIVHTWWLCELCYNVQLAEVEKRIAKEQDNG